MYFNSSYVLQALALSITLSLSSPLSANSKRQDLTLDDCASNRTTPDRRCWQLVGVPQYLVDQTTGWIKTTPVCEDRTRCCGPSEVWSTCFLRLATGQEQDCTVLGDRQCARTNQLDPSLASSIRTQVKYIVLAIFGVHDYYTASYFSLLSAIALVPPQDNDGFANLIFPNLASLSPGERVQTTEPLQQAESNVREVFQQIASSFAEVLKTLMSNADTFVRFVGTGSVDAPWTPLNQSDAVTALNTTLQTYYVSDVMKQTNWYAIPLASSAQPDPSQPIYLSPSTRRQYRLAQEGEATTDPSTMIQELPTYADMTLLFDGAFNCTATGRANDEGEAYPGFSYDGTLNLGCASLLPMRLECGAPCPTNPLANGTCLFTHIEGC